MGFWCLNISVIVNFTYVTDVSAFSVLSVTDVSVSYFPTLSFKSMDFMLFLYIRPELFNFPFYDISFSEDYPFSLILFWMLIFISSQYFYSNFLCY